MTRDLWTPEEVQHYSVTYPVRGHQGLVQDIHATASVIAAGIQQAATSQHPYASNNPAAWDAAAVANFEQTMNNVDHLGNSFQQAHAAATLHDSMTVSSSHQQALVFPTQNFGGALPAYRDCNPAAAAPTPVNGMHQKPSSHSNYKHTHGVASSRSFGRSIGSMTELSRASSSLFDDSLCLGDDKMQTCNAEIDQMFQAPMPFPQKGFYYQPKAGELSYNAGDALYSIMFPQPYNNLQRGDVPSDAALQAQGQPGAGNAFSESQYMMARQGPDSAAILMPQSNEQQQQQHAFKAPQPQNPKYTSIMALKPIGSMDSMLLQVQIDQAQRRLNQLLQLQQQSLARSGPSRQHSFTMQQAQVPGQGSDALRHQAMYTAAPEIEMESR